MKDEKQALALNNIRKVTVLTLLTNLVLCTLKLIVGFMTGSISLVADGVHSFSDMATDFGVILGVYISSKKPDKLHPYGHGRAETFAALFVAIFLISCVSTPPLPMRPGS